MTRICGRPGCIVAAAVLISVPFPVHAQVVRSQDARPVRLVETHVIEANVTGPVDFSLPSALLPHGDTAVLVMQTQERSLRLLGLDGTPLRRIGRDGEGPGEFRRPAGMGWYDGGVWVGDASLRRVTAFDGDFTVRDTWRSPPVTLPTPYLQGRSALLFDGSRMGVPRNGTGGYRAFSGPPPPVPLWREGQDGTLELLAEVGTDRLCEPFNLGGGALTSLRRLFVPGALYALAPDGGTLAWLSVDRQRAPGRLVLEVRNLRSGVHTQRDVLFPSPVVIPESRRREAVDQVVRTLQSVIEEGAGTRAPSRRDLERLLDVPRNYPAVDLVRVTNAGTVWLRHGDETGRWLLIHADDRTESVDLPTDGDVLFVSDDQVWIAQVDPFGLPTLRRFAVRR